MVSDFLLLDDEPFFFLNDKQWEKASKKYPSLLNDKLFIEKTATLHLEPGKNRDGYMDNEMILKQFERLFQLYEFKDEYSNRKLLLLVDNATTHTAKAYSINDFHKKIGTQCPSDTIEWVENGITRKAPCFFSTGKFKGKSKGLFELGKDLKLIPKDAKVNDKVYSLNKLRELLSKHDAFKNKSNLEILAEKYGVCLKFVPKYHCELSPIEALWAFMKNYVRSNTEGTFESMKKLMEKSRILFKEKGTSLKLWNRFFKVTYDYKNQVSFKDILTKYFGFKCKTDVINHRRITNIPY